MRVLLSVGLLQQGAPELAWGGRATEQQRPFLADRQAVVHHHVRPAAKTPKAEVEDSGVQVGTLGVPLLLLVVRNHLTRFIQ